MNKNKDYETIKKTLADHGFSCEYFAVNSKTKQSHKNASLESGLFDKLKEDFPERYGVIIRDAHAPKFAYPITTSIHKPEITITFTGELADLSNNLNFALLNMSADDLAYMMLAGKDARTEAEFKGVFKCITRHWNLPQCMTISLPWSGEMSKWTSEGDVQQDCKAFKEYAQDYFERLTDVGLKLDTIWVNQELPFSQDIVSLLDSLDIMVEDVTMLYEEARGTDDVVYEIYPASQQDEDMKIVMCSDGTEKMFIDLLCDRLMRDEDQYDAKGYPFNETLLYDDRHDRSLIDMVDADIEFMQKIRALYKGLADLRGKAMTA